MDRMSLFVMLLLACSIVSAIPDECYMEFQVPYIVCDGPTPWDCHMEYRTEREVNPFIQPQIVSVRVEPTSVYVNDDVTVEVDAKDATISGNGGVGIKEVKVSIGSRSTSLSLDSGDAVEGTWKGSIKAPGEGKHAVEVEVEDLCLHVYRGDDEATLTVLSSGGNDDENKDLDVGIGAGCANEAANVTVTEKGNGISVEGATVVLNYKDSEVDSDKTDGDGKATVTPASEGDYELVVLRSGYNAETETFSIKCTRESGAGEGGEGSAGAVEAYYNVTWLPINEQLFYAGAKNVVEAVLQNTGNGEARGVGLSVVNCPANWECGIAPDTPVVIGPNETFDAYAWFVVPENESENEKTILLSSNIENKSDEVTFKAGIKLKETANVSAEEAEAFDAINKMNAEIENARKEGINVSGATNLLVDAQDAYASNDYGHAQSYATLILAQLAEEAAAAKEQTGETKEKLPEVGADMLGMVAVVVVALLIIALVAVYFTSRKTKKEQGIDEGKIEREIGEAVKKSKKK
jgi:hypothetical protein